MSSPKDPSLPTAGTGISFYHIPLSATGNTRVSWMHHNHVTNVFHTPVNTILPRAGECLDKASNFLRCRVIRLVFH